MLVYPYNTPISCDEDESLPELWQHKPEADDHETQSEKHSCDDTAKNSKECASIHHQTALPISYHSYLMQRSQLIHLIPFVPATLSLLLPLITYLTCTNDFSNSLPTINQSPAAITILVAIGATAITYIICNYVFYYYAIAEYLLGNPYHYPLKKEDDSTAKDDNWFCFCAVVANTRQFFFGTLFFRTALRPAINSPITLWSLCFSIGTLFFMMGMLLEIPIAFRRRAESREKENHPIKSLFNQPILKLFYPSAKFFIAPLLALYILVNAIATTLSCAQLVVSLSKTRELPLLPVAFLISLLVTPCVAFVRTNFNYAQLNAYLEADMYRPFLMETTQAIMAHQSQPSTYPHTALAIFCCPVRLALNFASGQTFYGWMRKGGLSIQFSVYSILLGFSLASSAAALLSINSYLASYDIASIRAKESSLLLIWLLGEKKAIENGSTIFLTAGIPLAFFAGTLPALASRLPIITAKNKEEGMIPCANAP